MELFENQSSDFLFGKNDYIEILWGVEEFLVQREYYLVHIHGFYILIIYLLNTNQIHQRISLGNYYVRGIIFQHLAKVMTK